MELAKDDGLFLQLGRPSTVTPLDDAKRRIRLNIKPVIGFFQKNLAAKENMNEASSNLLPAFTPVEHQTLRDNAYAQLRDALMTGQFEPGQHITIRGLASALGVSPTPIREALRRLAAERAIEAEPNRWMRIPVLSVDQLTELRAIRIALEGLAAAHAARRITDVELEDIRHLEAQIVALRPRGERKEMIPLISRLHFAIYRAAAMPDLLRIIESLWLRSAPYSNLLFPGYTRVERGKLRASAIAALERRDSLATREFLEADIGGALDYLIDLAKGDDWPSPVIDSVRS